VTAILSREQRRTLDAFLDELYRWNRRVNLTRVVREDAWSRHVDESLALLDVAVPAARVTLVDVGSGAGVPGLIVAVARPELEVTLVESDRRKVAFLTHIAGALALSNVRVVPFRAEAVARDPARRETFDVALARALAPPSVVLELALPLVRVGGRLCALVAGGAEVAARCAAAAQVLGGAQPEAKDGALLVAKVAPTPARYPRGTSARQRRPLA
jgi:16S rRNA (guanine527-N7)-methyltransferase